MQRNPAAQMSRSQKLQWYAGQLISDAATAEKNKLNDAAIKDYLSAAEILLLLAKAEENYTAWKAYSDRAEQCQKRARMLIAVQPKPEETP